MKTDGLPQSVPLAGTDVKKREKIFTIYRIWMIRNRWNGFGLMQKLSFFLLTISVFLISNAQPGGPSNKFVLVVHGGAGTILKSQMTPEKEKAYTDALNEALEKGSAILSKGGSALDAVEASIRLLEDNPLFNAGKGAVFTNEGKNELDASIMNGKTLEAGAVAGVTTIKNPVSAARAVMEKSAHVMMVGKGAEQFADQQGLELVDPSYFFTENRWEGLQKAKKDDAENGIDSSNKSINKSHVNQTGNHDNKYGTVGAVALDQHGNLAAATSTGGMSNKKFGRVGDAPIIGAGTYASNKTVAISGTGWGEYFIRLVMAKTISDMMEFGKMKLKQAADEMIMKRLPALGGDGGLIAVDKDGNIAMPFCTAGMYRGYVKEGGKQVVEIYK
ncbi:MAG: isoaspartyl peptidase/L-asparaginase family protein [Chitinophagaceae bacterium]